MRQTLTACVFLLAATAVQAASPSLKSVRPPGAQRGTEVQVVLSGERLGDAQEIFYFQPGLTTTNLEKVDDKQVKATITIAPDCPLGLHDLRLRTATGISELRTFSVGALPEVSEVEPNNDFATPQVIAMNTVVNGVAQNEDVDYYAVTAKKGERITAEVEGIRLGITMFDPYVAIMDAKRFELASSDDAALVWQDGSASIIAPEDGTYLIQVRESAYAGNANCLYRLHVGNFPRPTATLPSGGKAGEKMAVTWIGDVAGTKTTEATLPASPDPRFGLVAQDEQGIAPYPNLVRVSPFGNVIEVEPNDDHAGATAFTPPLALNGVIEKPGDIDHFAFTAKKGQALDVRVFARALRSPLDSVLTIAKKGGGNLATNDDSGGPDSYLRFTAPADGDYVVGIRDQLKNGGSDYTYRIEVTPVEPKLAITVPNEGGGLRRTGPVVVEVPRGNRQALLVTAARADFGGVLNIGAEGLPAGMEIESAPMAAGIATFPVLLTAKADAPVAGALATITGAPADPNVKVPPSTFHQTVELVLGQNNVPFWTRSVDRLAAAVTEEAPFSIEIVEPKVPLVRGGSMSLKVVAKRAEGFKAPIAVSLPWNPPGVNSGGGVSIAEGSDEAVIPVNADAGAALDVWKVVVNGTATGPNGPITVSSQLAKLAVAPQFVTLAYQNAAVEQGAETDLIVKVNKAVDFPGEATVTLVGLPNKASTDVKTITKDSTELVFHIKTDKTTPVGNTTNLFCQVVITQDGEPILHNLGSGALRVDAPLPPKPNAPPKPAVAEAKPKTEAPPKPLSRLEKLRQEAAEKAAAGAP